MTSSRKGKAAQKLTGGAPDESGLRHGLCHLARDRFLFLRVAKHPARSAQMPMLTGGPPQMHAGAHNSSREEETHSFLENFFGTGGRKLRGGLVGTRNGFLE